MSLANLLKDELLQTNRVNDSDNCVLKLLTTKTLSSLELLNLPENIETKIDVQIIACILNALEIDTTIYHSNLRILMDLIISRLGAQIISKLLDKLITVRHSFETEEFNSSDARIR